MKTMYFLTAFLTFRIWVYITQNEIPNGLWFLGQIPTLDGVPNDGLCDIRRQDCVRTRVQGNSFIDNEQLSCQMVESKVGISSFVA